MLAVSCSGLSKRYRRRRIGYRTLRETIGALTSGRPAPSNGGMFWAVHDLSLEIRQGEAFGLIGQNGSGKSTLLKMIAGVTRPTRGRLEVFGRVGALIEVGTGLHPELTGQENIYLYGTILGLPRQEIRRKFDQIVAFAELNEFLDTPVKQYSSGMRVRLGFAVAAHLDPQILLVDEALAVGDVAFQRKCLRAIRKLRDDGITTIFVSHDLPAIGRICQRVAWLDGGRLREVGPSGEVVHDYLDAVEQEFFTNGQGSFSGRALLVHQVTISDTAGTPRQAFAPNEPVVVNLHYDAGPEPVRAVVTFKVTDDRWSTLVVADSQDDPRGLTLRGRGVVRCVLGALPLGAKTYQVWGRVLRLPDHREEIPWRAMGAVAITGPRLAASIDPQDWHEREIPTLQVPSEWSLVAADPAGIADA
jgi:lipopolysaccharide transport system ATP-binding protein